MPFLDRLGGPFSSTFRPQEALSAQVLDAAVRSVNAARPDAVLVTGDLVDNAQANELALARTVLDGGRAEPDSGAPGYQGVQAAADPDPAYYRPDVDPPRHRGLLDAAQRPFRAAGPARAVVRGAGQPRPARGGRAGPDAVDRGGRRRRRAPRHARRRARRAAQRERAHPAARRPRAERRAARGPRRAWRPIPARRELTPQEAVAGLRAASGHGGSGARMDYAFDAGRAVRVIVLDTVRRDVGSGGVLSAEQTRWLAGQLAAAGDAPRRSSSPISR